ncbi:MAG: hypothetical protein GC161_10485 [Planctomycetaceae bacterium]|nr:hypothetical protein [Planctomycetaceae bacterium]
MLSLTLAALLSAAFPAPLAQDPTWLPAFGELPGVGPSLVPTEPEQVRAFAEYDDGTGPAVYVAGGFQRAGAALAARVAKWDGSRWGTLGAAIGGINANILDLAPFGGRLYAGGRFLALDGTLAFNLASWDGSAWTGLVVGNQFSSVRALAVHDAGDGAALYVGGDFATVAGSVPAAGLARWDGAAFSAVPPLPGGGVVEALFSFDDGAGAALYCGRGAGFPISRLDGGVWSDVGGTLDGVVRSFAVFDDGNGPALHAGGDFTLVGAQVARRVMRFDGNVWQEVGGGLPAEVRALRVWNGGGAPRLLAAGAFTQGQGAAADRLVAFHGSQWTALASGFGLASGQPVVAALGSNSQGELFVGGQFDQVDGEVASGVARFDGTTWRSLGDGFDGAVLDLTRVDLGGGAALYAGGAFQNAPSAPASRVARYDGSAWHPLGAGLDGDAQSLVRFDDGTGAALYVGGSFANAGGNPAVGVARWDGAAWSDVGGGIAGAVFDLAVHDDGTGAALYAAGEFSTAGGVAADRVARFDGVTWSSLGQGLMGGTVRALLVHDDGSGPKLFAGGDFEMSGQISVSRIARWDGTTWSGVTFGMNGSVFALASFEEAGVSSLFAGGAFTTAGGNAAARVARWSGGQWSAVGAGANNTVQWLGVADDGAGSALFASGSFTALGALQALRLARWDGNTWSAPGGDFDGVVRAAAPAEDGVGTALFLAGDFFLSPAGDSFLARRGPPTIVAVPGCGPNTATLGASAPAAPLGSALQFELQSTYAQTGLAVLYVGVPGADGQGCGLPLLGAGEILLALSPAPAPVIVLPLFFGAAEFALGVPDLPVLKGVEVALQGLAIDALAPAPFELSNALVARLGP